MPQFILYIAVTLDGYIASSDGGIDWLKPFEVDGEDYGYDAFYSTIDALIMGSTTYEQVLGFGEWPYPGKPSYVLTNRQLSSDRDDIRFVNGGVEAVVQELHAQNNQRTWIVGGGKVASAFMVQGLIDEYILTVMPVMLGAGVPLFQSIPEQRLKFVGAKSYVSGAVELRYGKLQKPDSI